jgi:hypothetical protein
VALYAFKAYFNRSWLFGFRFHLCHWKRWKGQLCDLSSLKVTPQADWLCQCYVSGLSAADGLQVPLGQGHKRPAARKVIRWRCQIGHSTAQRPKSQWLARWSISWIELSYVHIHIHIYILYYIVYIVYIYIRLYIYTYILYYYIIYIYIFVLEVYSCSKLAAAERYNVPEGKKIFVLEVYSGNTLCWRVGIRLICMKPHGFGLIHARHKSFTEWCYT